MDRSERRHLAAQLTSSIWAIQPRAHTMMLEATLADDVEAAAEAVRAETGARRGQGQGVRSGSGVAVVPVHGVIRHREGGWYSMFGGCTCERMAAVLDELGKDEDIGTIIFDMNTPGGSVYGVPEVGAKIRELAGRKRVIAIANALTASAGYWWASQASEVVVTPSGEAGSIGVFLAHTDISKMFEDWGVKITLISAGKYKTEGNPYEELGDEAKEHLQSSVNDYYGLFVRAVADGRGVSEEDVREGLGEGRVLTAQRAVEAGLADRVATLDELLAELGIKASHSRDAIASLELVTEGAAAAFLDVATPSPAPAIVPAAATSTLGGGELDTALAVQRPTLVHMPEAADADASPPTDPEAEAPGAEGEDSREPTLDAAAEGAAPGDSITPQEPAPVAEETEMSGNGTPAPGGANGSGATATVGEDALAQERKRCQEIAQLCKAHNQAERAEEFIDAGHSVDRVGFIILQEQEASRPGSTQPKSEHQIELNERENKQYSIARLIGAIADNKPQNAGFELEVHEELASKMSYTPKGVLVPTNLPALTDPRYKTRFTKAELQQLEYKGQLTTGNEGGGQEFVFIEPGSFIDMLRSRMVTTQMGATFIPGLRGNVDFPKQDGAGEFSWVDEAPANDSPGDSDLDTTLVSLRPRNGRTITSYSRTLLAQSVVNIEQLVRADQAAITSRGIDRAALHGTGGNQPTGIYSASGVHPINFAAIDNLFTAVVAMETAIAASDADIGTMGYVTTPGARGQFKTTLTFPASAAGMPIWTGAVRDGEMNGFRAMASTQVRKDLGGGDEHGIIKGVWSQLLIGEWGAMDVLVDPYTRGGRGLIRVITFAIVDVALRYPEAFAKGTGLTVSLPGS